MPRIWPRMMVVAGSVALLVGAVDPIEGALLILPGSGLVSLGTFLAREDRRLIAFRLSVFLMIAFGVGALFGLSSIGGIGGRSGHSPWWGVLILPYLIGWSMSIWGPGSPRWLPALGIGVGLWYLALCAMLSRKSGPIPGEMSTATIIVLAVLGIVTIGGCLRSLATRPPDRSHA